MESRMPSALDGYMPPSPGLERRLNAHRILDVANHFVLASGPDPRGDEAEDMHLVLTEEMGAYFARISARISTAGLADIDPYADTTWSPEEAAAMVDRLQRVYDEVTTLWPWGELGESEPPEEVGYREGVTDFLFWLRRLFMEATARRMYVIAVGD
jgi:hypothetical protein